MKTYNLKATKETWSSPINYIATVSEQEIRNLLKENPELLTPTPTHKRKYFVPKDYQYYYFIDDLSTIDKDTFRNNNHADMRNAKSGNCFATEQDAQDELNRRQALVRIWNNYDDKYSWDIDWSDRTQQKHYIGYSHDSTYPLLEDFHSYKMMAQTELPYFKSAEDRNQFVEANLSDLLIIFNIKK